MTDLDVIEELFYASYKAQRTHFADRQPRYWRSVYGGSVEGFEIRFQEECRQRMQKFLEGLDRRLNEAGPSAASRQHETDRIEDAQR